MHHGLSKMIIYTIIVLSLTRGVRTSAESKFYENGLYETLFDYRKFIDPKFLPNVPVSEDAAAAEEWIRPEVFQLLVYNMRFVMKLVSDFYQWTVLSEEDAAAFAEEGRKVTVRRSVYEPRNLIETVVCTHFPRLLAFLYVCTNDQSAYVQLHRLHLTLCVKMHRMKTKSGFERAVESVSYACDVKTVTLLHEIKREFPNPIMSTEKDRIRGAGFVANALGWTKGVDKKRMLNTTVHLNGGRRNVFGAAEGDFYRGRTNGKKDGELDEGLRLLNFRYADEGELEKDTSVPDAVNRKMTRAFRTLVTLSVRAVRGLSDDDGTDDWTDDRNTVVRKLNTVTGGQCERVPLVLVYLTDNCGDAADTAVLFALYLTLCGDWTGYLDVHCPKGYDRFDDYACLKDAIESRLLVNFYSATGEFPDFDQNDEEDRNDNDDGDEITHALSAFGYIKAVLETARYYYAGLDDNVSVWTASGWLTGHFLLANYGRNPGIPDTPFAERTITLPGNGRRPASEVLLSEAYDLLLPWLSNARDVFAFHAVLFDQADRLLDDFVYRHAEIVRLYLRHVTDTADVTLSSRLSDSIGWYAKVAKTFSDDLPGPHEPRGERSVDGVVLAIENIGGETGLTKENLSDEYENILGVIPKEKQTEMSAWSKRQISKIKKLNDLDILNTMLHRICQNAVIYVNTFVMFVQKPKATRYNDKYFSPNYCDEFVKDVFVQSDPFHYLLN